MLSMARRSSTYSQFRPVRRIAIVRVFLRVMLGGCFDDHRPVYPPHILRSGAWSRRARARPFGGVARLCDGALITGLASGRRHAPCGLLQVRRPSPIRPALRAVSNRPRAASSPAKLLREDLLARPPDEALLPLSFGCTRGRSA